MWALQAFSTYSLGCEKGKRPKALIDHRPCPNHTPTIMPSIILGENTGMHLAAVTAILAKPPSPILDFPV
jgi:hypothetical protein